MARHQHLRHLDGPHWATPDGRIVFKFDPFSTALSREFDNHMYQVHRSLGPRARQEHVEQCPMFTARHYEIREAFFKSR